MLKSLRGRLVFISVFFIIVVMIFLFISCQHDNNDVESETKTEEVDLRLSEYIKNRANDFYAYRRNAPTTMDDPFYSTFYSDIFNSPLNVELDSVKAYDYSEILPYTQGIPNPYSGHSVDTLLSFNSHIPIQHIEVIDDEKIAVVIKVRLNENEATSIRNSIKSFSKSGSDIFFDEKKSENAYLFVVFKQNSNSHVYYRTGEVYVLNELLSYKDFENLKIGSPLYLLYEIDPVSVHNRKAYSTNEIYPLGIPIEKPAFVCTSFQRPLKEGILEIICTLDTSSQQSEITDITLYPYGDENNPDRFTLPNAEVFKCLEGK